MSSGLPEAGTQSRRTWWRSGYVAGVAAVILATGAAWPIASFVELGTLTMAYLLAIAAVAARHGPGPSVLTSIGSVAAFDFCFVPPYYTFTVAEPQYLLTFVVMLVVGLITGGLTARVRRQARAAQAREQRTAALLAMSRELAQTGGVEALAETAARHITQVFDADVRIVLPDAEANLVTCPRGDRLPIVVDELDASRWAFEHRQAAGPGTAMFPTATALHVPLVGSRGSLGVVVIRPRRRTALAAPEPRRQLETFVNQSALALERARLADEAQDARVSAEAERLRSSLLASVSHDLRTPLATITGAVTTMIESEGRVDPRTRQELLESVREEAERLNRLVHNLLEMTRLESGALQLRCDWHPLEEIVGAALGRFGGGLGDRRVAVTIPSDLPLVAVDDVLLEQVFVNLLDNAVKYTPPASPIRIIVTASERNVTVEVADDGPGLPRGEEDRVFEKFYRGPAGGRRGAGLGLAICRGIVQAHGGRIWAQSLPGSGVAFLFTLPLTDRPPATVPADA